MPSLLSLIENRLWESILWTRQRIFSGSEKPELLLHLALETVQEGYTKAITKEMILIQIHFLDPLASGSSKLIRNQDSCFAFLNELLLRARLNDLNKLKFSKLEYTKLYSKNVISKDIFVRQAVTGAIEQIKVSKAFSQLIKSRACKNAFNKRHEYLIQQ